MKKLTRTQCRKYLARARKLEQTIIILTKRLNSTRRTLWKVYKRSAGVNISHLLEEVR